MYLKILITLLAIAIQGQVAAWDVDLRAYQSPIKDQCDRNTCAYFSCTSMLESLIRVEFNRQVQLSEQYIIHLSKTKYKNKPDVEHADPYELMQQLRSEISQYHEEDIPYQKSYFRKGGLCEEFISNPAAAPDWCFSQLPFENLDALKPIRLFGLKLDHMSRMWTSKSRVETIKDRLEEKRSVVITVKIVPETWNDTTGHAHFDSTMDAKCSAGELECFGHAILLVGYDDQKKLFLFKNSWGEKWGQEGYGTIGYDYIENFAEQPYSLQFERLLKEFKD